VTADWVVVLNFRGRDDTLRCVESLTEGDAVERVLVVDNGSYDGTLEEVRRRWPSVATLQTGANLGFSGGMNAGVRRALSHGAMTVTVLNNDTVIPPGTMARLAHSARGGAAVSPEVRYLEGGRVWFGGGTVDGATALARHLSDEEIDHAFDGATTRSVDVLAGCCITASGETWRRVGGFDERFFLIFEDSDWSLRARSLGVELIVDSSVHIEHQVSASFTGSFAFLGMYYYTRNGLCFGHRWSAHRGDSSGMAMLRSVRFLRRHVAPAVAAPARADGDWAGTVIRAVIVLAAVSDHARGMYGKAPQWLERVVAARWAKT
jgi:GT2 family glycosyltransferase